jgi:hypothetical protein
MNGYGRERRKWMRGNTLRYMGLGLLVLSACAGARTFIVDLTYVPQSPPVLDVERAVVAIAPFVDKRNGQRDVGLRSKLDGSVDQFITAPDSVGGRVRKAVERYLRANGFQTVTISEWDFQPESLSVMEADMVVGGEVHRLWSYAESMVGRTVIHSDLAMSVYLGNPEEDKVLQQKMEISREITEIVFSPRQMEKLLNESLSEVIESVFEALLGQR